MSTEAVISRIGDEDDLQVCRIEGCGKQAAYQVVKIKPDASEEEKFFCEEHGREYATRGHLVISNSV